MTPITVDQTNEVLQKQAFLRNFISSMRLKKDKVSKELKGVVDQAKGLGSKSNPAASVNLPTGKQNFILDVRSGNEAQALKGVKDGSFVFGIDLPPAANIPTKAHELAELASMAHPNRTLDDFNPATMYRLPEFATKPILSLNDYLNKENNGIIGGILSRQFGRQLNMIDPRSYSNMSPLQRSIRGFIDGRISFRDNNNRIVFGNVLGNHMSPDVYVAEALAARDLGFIDKAKAMLETSFMRHLSGEGPLYRKALTNPEVVTNYNLRTPEILDRLGIKYATSPIDGKLYANTRTGLFS